MELKNQVCSLDLSKKLKKLGVKQESLWSWIVFYNNSSTTPLQEFEELISEEQYLQYEEKSYLKLIDKYSAFTTSELGELLPIETLSQKEEVGNFLSVYKNEKKEHFIVANIEANARAKMLIYLIEKKLMKV